MATITRWCNGCGQRVPLTKYTQKGLRNQRKCDDCVEGKVTVSKKRWQ